MGRRVKVLTLRSIIPAVILLFSVFLFSSCASGSFFHQRYVNLVSYFNTFYNAQRLFNEAEAELETALHTHEIQRRNVPFEVPRPITDKFNNVIEKCSRILAQYPSSKYADNAVYLIGKSYYYTNQNLQAERKFFELLANFPHSTFVPETQLLLAKTQMRMNKKGEAIITLHDMLEGLYGRRDRDIRAEAQIVLGDIYKIQGNYDDAIAQYTEAAGSARDRELETQAYFLHAQVLEKIDRIDEAFEMYTEVIEGRPSTIELFESQVARVRILTKFSSYDDAHDILQRMLRDLQLREFEPNVNFEIGEVYRHQGLYEDAIDRYVHVDTMFSRSDIAPKARVALGTIYEEIFGDYKIASEYYEKGRGRGQQQTEIQQYANKKADQFKRYWTHRNEIKNLDTLIVHLYTLLEEGAIDDTSSAIAAIKKQYLIPDTLKTEDVNDNDTTIIIDKIDVEKVLADIQKKNEGLNRAIFELAGLFYIEMERSDSAYYWYDRLMKEFPESDYAAPTIYTLAEIVRDVQEGGSYYPNLEHLQDHSRDSLYYLLIEQYPDTDYALQAKRILDIPIAEQERDPLELSYIEAENLLVDGEYSAALSLFRTVAKQGGESEFIPRSRYAVGWIFENIYLYPDSAAANYKKLIDNFPQSIYAQQVEEKVNLWKENNAVDDTTAIVTDDDIIHIDEQDTTEFTQPPTEIIQDDTPERGIPITRPTDRGTRRGGEDKPDTTQYRQDED